MNRIMPVILLLALALPAAADEPFRIALPDGFGALSATPAKTTAAAEGKIATTNWIAKAPSGEAVVVTLSRMPGKILDPDKLFASTRDSLLKSLNATLESEETLSGNRPSTRLLFRSEAPAFLRSRLVIDGNRFFQVLYVGRSAEQRAVPAVAQIFDSFEITP